MTRALLVLVAVLVLISPWSAAAQSVGMEESLPALGDPREARPPLRLAERATAPSLLLAPALEAAAFELDEIADWNRTRQQPAKIGFARPLPEAQRVDLASSVLDPALRSGEAVPYAGGLLSRTGLGELVWGARVEVADAHRVRLHLTEVDLPAGTQMWVYGGDNELVAFGLELLSEHERSLWTPSVGGGVVHLEVRVPPGLGETGAASSFVLGEVAEIFRLDRDGRPLVGVSPAPGFDISCLVDAQCVNAATFDVINAVQQSIAYVEFLVGSSVASCTGGLLNDTVPSTTVPLFQTANHCLSTQSAVNTAEAFWDYYAPSCGAPWPGLGTLPRSNGGQLLATGQATDFTLLRLNSIPPNRALLGWNANPAAVPHGTLLHRVSHPLGFAQAYSRSSVNVNAPTCSGISRPEYLYETHNIGGATPGSSGAPAILQGGQMVGQLRGGCGPNPTEGCDPTTNVTDGAFSGSFAAEAPFLNGSGFSPCVPGPATLCLHNNRFRVEVDWESQTSSGDGFVLSKLSDASGVFYFFNPNNAEMLVKVLNACVAPFNRFWVFYAATTNVEFTVTVTDTQADVVKSFYNPLGRAALPVQDTQAFATCP